MRYINIPEGGPLTHSICGRMVSQDGFLHHKRSMQWNVLVIVLSGVFHIAANGVEYDVHKGEYIFLRAGETHFGTKPSTGRLEYMWAHFAGEAPFDVCDSGKRNGFDFPEKGEIKTSSRTAELFHQLSDLTLDTDSKCESLMADYAVSMLLLSVADAYAKSFKKEDDVPAGIAAVAEWIRENYNSAFDVKKLAELFGYQADYLSSLFRKTMKVSITEYTKNIRLSMAKLMLSNYNLNICEIAWSNGFRDEKYFMKIFKAEVGMTPSEYKKAFGKQLLIETNE